MLIRLSIKFQLNDFPSGTESHLNLQYRLKTKYILKDGTAIDPTL